MKSNKAEKEQGSSITTAAIGLDESSPIPLYAQLADLIRADIAKGKLRKGDVVQTEKMLEETYAVSRTTVRNALAKLVDDGLLYRKRGKGTSVRQDKLTRQSPGLLGIHEEIRASGRKPETRIFSFEIIPNPTVDVRRSLELKRSEKVVRIERKVYADSELLGISVAFIPLRISEKIGLEQDRLENKSLYRLLEQGGFKPHEAEETIEVTTAGEELARKLCVSREFPLFSLKRIVYTREGLPIERGENIFRADRYAFKLHHWRPINL